MFVLSEIACFISQPIITGLNENYYCETKLTVSIKGQISPDESFG